MSEVYKEKPEVVEVQVTLDGKDVPAVYVVGRTVPEIESAIAAALHGLAGARTDAPVKKARKARRTKKEMLAEKPILESAPPHEKAESASGGVWP